MNIQDYTARARNLRPVTHVVIRAVAVEGERWTADFRHTTRRWSVIDAVQEALDLHGFDERDGRIVSIQVHKEVSS